MGAMGKGTFDPGVANPFCTIFLPGPPNFPTPKSISFSQSFLKLQIPPVAQPSRCRRRQAQNDHFPEKPVFVGRSRDPRAQGNPPSIFKRGVFQAPLFYVATASSFWFQLFSPQNMLFWREFGAFLPGSIFRESIIWATPAQGEGGVCYLGGGVRPGIPLQAYAVAHPPPGPAGPHLGGGGRRCRQRADRPPPPAAGGRRPNAPPRRPPVPPGAGWGAVPGLGPAVTDPCHACHVDGWTMDGWMAGGTFGWMAHVGCILLLY